MVYAHRPVLKVRMKIGVRRLVRILRNMHNRGGGPTAKEALIARYRMRMDKQHICRRKARSRSYEAQRPEGRAL